MNEFETSYGHDITFVIDAQHEELKNHQTTFPWAELFAHGLVAAVLDAPAGHPLNRHAETYAVARIRRDVLGPDGILLSALGDVKRWRQTLPQDKVIGSLIQDSKHEGMLAAEHGADFVVLISDDEERRREYITWWTTLMNCSLAVPYHPSSRPRPDDTPDMLLATPEQVLAVCNPKKA